MKLLKFTTKANDGDTTEWPQAVLARDVVGITAHDDGGTVLYLDRCNLFKTELRTIEPFDVILNRLEHILAEGN